MTEDKNENESIRNDVLRAIEAGHIHMRPKWYFVLGAALILAGIALLILTGVYLVSFIIFILHQTGVWFVPGFGGVGLMLRNLPWLMVLMAIIFVVVLEVLVRKYSFGYRKPFLYSALAVILLVLVGGSVVAQTSLHRGLFEMAQDERLPLGGKFYRQFGLPQPPDNMVVGTLTELSEKGFLIQDPRGEVLTIITDDDTEYPNGKQLDIGDRMVIMGERQDSTMDAASVREIDDDDFPMAPGYRRHQMMPR